MGKMNIFCSPRYESFDTVDFIFHWTITEKTNAKSRVCGLPVD